MKHIRNYSTSSEKYADIVRPRMYIIGDDLNNVYCDNDHITSFKSGTIKFNAVSSGTYTVAGSTYNFKYSLSSTDVYDNFIVYSNKNKKFIVKLGERYFTGTIYHETYMDDYYCYFLGYDEYGGNLCIYYSYVAPSGQGAHSTIIKTIYSSHGYSTSANINYEIYLIED